LEEEIFISQRTIEKRWLLKNIYMGSRRETGHAINIANFERIIGMCAAFEGQYQPTNPDIFIANMRTMLTGVTHLHEVYLDGKSKTVLPIGERQELFVKMCKTVLRAQFLFESTGASEEAIRDVKGWVQRITGSNVRRKNRKGHGRNNPSTSSVSGDERMLISNSHLGFDQRTATFEMLIAFLKLDENYKPNEPELQIASLDTMLNDMNKAMRKADEKLIEADFLRIDRDKAMYGKGGMIDVSLACKKYVRAVFGARSVEARAVTGIYLRRMVRIR
jgi:hypothetical protein